MKLTKPQREVLECMAAGWEWRYKRSWCPYLSSKTGTSPAMPVHCKTIGALAQRGLITRYYGLYVLTPAGREAAKEAGKLPAWGREAGGKKR